MKIKYLLSAIVFILSSLGHAAVSPGAQPSELDIHAAYCVGTEEHEAAWENNADATSKDKRIDFHKRIAASAQARNARLRQYLDRRFGSAKPDAIIDATKNGLADAQFVLSDSRIKDCTQKCKLLPLIGASDEEVKRCMAPCDDRLPKVWSCKELSWLR